MHRLLTFCFFLGAAAAAALGLVASAAPLPRDAEPPPVCYTTQLGDRSVYDWNGTEFEKVVTHVERTDDGLQVTSRWPETSKSAALLETVLVSAQGICQTWCNNRPLPAKPWMLKLPHATGNDWTARWDLGPYDWSFQTLGWEDIEVPAGRFRAVKVEKTEIEKQVVRTWYAPRVGVVRGEFDWGVMVLKSFTAGKP